MPMAYQRAHSGTRGAEISTQIKQQESKRLHRIAGRPTSGSKSAQSQMAMMQASIMQQNNMMMMQMMSQQQQRYVGNQMAWSQQHGPPSSAEVRVTSLYLCCISCVMPVVISIGLHHSFGYALALTSGTVSLANCVAAVSARQAYSASRVILSTALQATDQYCAAWRAMGCQQHSLPDMFCRPPLLEAPPPLAPRHSFLRPPTCQCNTTLWPRPPPALTWSARHRYQMQLPWAPLRLLNRRHQNLRARIEQRQLPKKQGLTEKQP